MTRKPVGAPAGQPGYNNSYMNNRRKVKLCPKGHEIEDDSSSYIQGGEPCKWCDECDKLYKKSQIREEWRDK